MKARCRIAICVLLLMSDSALAASASGSSVVGWVNQQSQSHQVMDPDSINLGWSVFDETQLRFETDRDGVFSDQEVRFSVKPLFGISNQSKLVDQQKNLKQLYKVEMQNQNLLFLYRKVLQAWKILQIRKIFGRSSKLFTRAQRQLEKYSRSNRALTTSLISDLTFYVENKAKVDHLEKKIQSQIFAGRADVVRDIQAMKLLSDRSILDYLEKAPAQPNSEVEAQEKQLQEMQFTQKKLENRQLLKFVSMSRQKGINRFEDYRVQVALRVPFLSDSLEFEEAKTEYLREGQKIQLAKIKKQGEYDEIVTELQGLIKKNEILKWVPQKSYSDMRVSGQLGTLSDAVKSEAQLIKIQVAAIENRALILDHYLQLLVMNGQLSSVRSNVLTQKLTTIQ